MAMKNLVINQHEHGSSRPVGTFGKFGTIGTLG